MDPDSDPSRLSPRRAPSEQDPPRRTPEENRPGHHPETEQDRPPLDEVAERLGTKPPSSEPAAGSVPVLTRVRSGAAIGLMLVALGIDALGRGIRRVALGLDDDTDDDAEPG